MGGKDEKWRRKDMFDRLKRMFEDERALGGNCCGWCLTCSEAIDVLCCGGQGLGRGQLVPVINQILKLIF